MIENSQPFSLFLDTDKMKAIFQQELPECLHEGWHLTACEIQHPRYKTYLNPQSFSNSFLALAYHLKGFNKVPRKAVDRILYVQAFLGDRSRTVFQNACDKDRNSNNPVPLHFEKLGMVAWYFPHDPVLTALPTLVSETTMKGYLAEYVSNSKQQDVSGISDCSIDIINYRPEIRCTLRYRLSLNSGCIDTVYGKAFADEKGVAIHDRMEKLYRQNHQNPYRFIIPEPIGYDAALKLVWLEGLEGCPLIEAVNQTNAKILMVRLAQCLAELHTIQLIGLDTITENDQRSEVNKKAKKLQSAFPLFAKRIEKLLTAMNEESERLPLIPHQLIHGDFHIQQLMMTPEQHIALFDFDELAYANPLTDVANFSADLYSLRLDEKLTDQMVTYFFNAYRSFSRLPVKPETFIWYMKVQLLTRAYRAYIQQKPNLNQIFQRFLSAAETCRFDDDKGYFHV